MRIALVILAVAVAGLLAFSSNPTSQVGPSQAFADEVMSSAVRMANPCARYCNIDEDLNRFCGSTPTGNVGCAKIVNNNCIFTLCG